MDVDWHTILKLTVTAVVVISWVGGNDSDIAKATRPDAGFPWFHGVALTYCLFVIPRDVIDRDWLDLFCAVTVAAMCVRVIWHWWRRRRQGKSSRVLGVVRDMGHRLATVNVPATEGVQHRAV